ncbi:tyrosine-type recombinase/integrase [Bradyrhizobium sp. CCGUVB23]|uniref:tyrosine-type recombinase/integrase n=1 Tax=Bradyrhizobium sp. CCGUVB23 TaxID=2949630 RepID=UPI0020B2F675|nr:tyrosine-type recombinase/integrase [Bradyrhizobium sp. CCGUVB23]MCP3460809.1 tyrosine-type recombinase/integrase [Bradyrhizobium sp. CCGUVB23]MCP3463558.1 tyrosine-type recombinase/integrase [Bradyrhizobium sp. CCGUVB23]MCP3468155.1 tyrosine-type recombinase/integrase [Bradyrhizobium sp. CCGUVB23]
MNSLRTALDEYLGARRALGHKLILTGRLLRRFVDFAEHAHADYITPELALKWATQPAHAQPSQWANRLGMVRRFARYCYGNDPRTKVPPPDLLPHRYRRVAPYIYSDEQIIRLLKAARRLPSTNGLRPHTYATLFGLYVATGLRANEALCLRREDVDLANGVLTIRDTKFGKTRFVPVHLSTRRALERYAKLRDRLCRTPASPHFFLSDRGTRVTYDMLRWTFVKVSHEIGLRAPGDSHGPRLHGFRHRLAINTLLKWYRGGIDVERRLPTLATYLGHAHITDTQWYLTATPQLLRYALRRVERSERRARP